MSAEWQAWLDAKLNEGTDSSSESSSDDDNATIPVTNFQTDAQNFVINGNSTDSSNESNCYIVETPQVQVKVEKETIYNADTCGESSDDENAVNKHTSTPAVQELPVASTSTDQENIALSTSMAEIEQDTANLTADWQEQEDAGKNYLFTFTHNLSVSKSHFSNIIMTTLPFIFIFYV